MQGVVIIISPRGGEEVVLMEAFQALFIALPGWAQVEARKLLDRLLDESLAGGEEVGGEAR